MIAGDFARAVEQGHGVIPIFEHPELGPGEMMPVLALWNLQDTAVIADRIVQPGDALLLDAQDIIALAHKRNVGRSFLGRGDGEARVVLSFIDLGQPAVGRLARRHPVHALAEGGKRFCNVSQTRSIRPRACGL